MQIHQAVIQEEKPDESSQDLDGSPVSLLMVEFFNHFLYVFLMISFHNKPDNLKLSLQRSWFHFQQSRGDTNSSVLHSQLNQGGRGGGWAQ